MPDKLRYSRLFEKDKKNSFVIKLELEGINGIEDSTIIVNKLFEELYPIIDKKARDYAKS